MRNILIFTFCLLFFLSCKKKEEEINPTYYELFYSGNLVPGQRFILHIGDGNATRDVYRATIHGIDVTLYRFDDLLWGITPCSLPVNQTVDVCVMFENGIVLGNAFVSDGGILTNSSAQDFTNYTDYFAKLYNCADTLPVLDDQILQASFKASLNILKEKYDQLTDKYSSFSGTEQQNIWLLLRQHRYWDEYDRWVPQYIGYHYTYKKGILEADRYIQVMNFLESDFLFKEPVLPFQYNEYLLTGYIAKRPDKAIAGTEQTTDWMIYASELNHLMAELMMLHKFYWATQIKYMPVYAIDYTLYSTQGTVNMSDYSLAMNITTGDTPLPLTLETDYASVPKSLLTYSNHYTLYLRETEFSSLYNNREDLGIDLFKYKVPDFPLIPVKKRMPIPPSRLLFQNTSNASATLTYVWNTGLSGSLQGSSPAVVNAQLNILSDINNSNFIPGWDFNCTVNP